MQQIIVIILTTISTLWFLQVGTLWSLLGIDGKDFAEDNCLKTFSQKIRFILYWHIPLYPILKIMFNGLRDFFKD